MKAVDYFAGCGGFSTGAAMAGIKVGLAVNHWDKAVESHAKNHPWAEHACENLHHFNHNKVPRGLDLFLASPSCQGFSKARGTDEARHDVARMTPSVVVDAAEIFRPKTIVIENVTDMLEWVRFKAWKMDLECLSYDVSTNVLNAKEFGVAQDRERVIFVATLDRKAPTIQSPRLPERKAIEVIDFTKGKWFPIKDKVQATRDRVAKARADGYGDRFVFPYYGSGSGKTGRSLDRPIGTITTLDRWGAVNGDMMRVLTVDEVREFMSFPKGYWLAGTRRDQIMQLGNAVPPLMAAEAIRQATEGIA